MTETSTMTDRRLLSGVIYTTVAAYSGVMLAVVVGAVIIATSNHRVVRRVADTLPYVTNSIMWASWFAVCVLLWMYVAHRRKQAEVGPFFGGFVALAVVYVVVILVNAVGYFVWDLTPFSSRLIVANLVVPLASLAAVIVALLARRRLA